MSFFKLDDNIIREQKKRNMREFIDDIVINNNEDVFFNGNMTSYTQRKKNKSKNRNQNNNKNHKI